MANLVKRQPLVLALNLGQCSEERPQVQPEDPPAEDVKEQLQPEEANLAVATATLSEGLLRFHGL